MKQSVDIDGLDCPNCARALESEINKLSVVSNANIDFINKKLNFECKDFDLAIAEIKNVIKQVEPGARLNVNQEAGKKNFYWLLDLVTLLLGIGVGLCALLIPLPTWAFWILFVSSALLLGYKTYLKAVLLLIKGKINENLLITLSIIGATCIGEYMEGLMVVALYTIGKILENLALNKSRKSIEKLTKMQPEYATIIVNGKETRVAPSDVAVGEIIIVKAGERVPLDGTVVEGQTSLDVQSLTGESIPINATKGDNILSGAIVLDGVLKIAVTSEYKDSTLSKIMNLIENAADKKSKTETLISKITKWYTLGVIILSIVVWGIVWAVTGDINTAVYRGLIFLVVSCPCAFAISVPLAYFSGLGNASRKGILIKGSNYLDACAKLNMIAFDKTGTLTTGQFVVNDVKSFDDAMSPEDIIFIASLGEQNSLHPLAKSIVNHNKRGLVPVSNVKEVAGRGVSFEYNGKNYFVGRHSKNVQNTVVQVYRDETKIGEIILSDAIKESSFEACKELKQLNVKTILLSGDNKEIVEKVGNQLAIDDIRYQLLPQEKYEYIEKLKLDKQNRIGYVGDGINDAPSLMLADVGISMGINGSPASIDASDIVLVDDNPKKVATAIKISKYTRRIVWGNIILSAGIKFIFLLLGALGITGMLSAVFADVGVTLLAILNSMRALVFNPKDINTVNADQIITTQKD